MGSNVDLISSRGSKRRGKRRSRRRNLNPSRNHSSSSGIPVGSRGKVDRISNKGSSLSPNRNSYNSSSNGSNSNNCNSSNNSSSGISVGSRDKVDRTSSRGSNRCGNHRNRNRKLSQDRRSRCGSRVRRRRHSVLLLHRRPLRNNNVGLSRSAKGHPRRMTMATATGTAEDAIRRSTKSAELNDQRWNASWPRRIAFKAMMTETVSHPAMRVRGADRKECMTSARLVRTSSGMSAKGSAKLRTT